MTFCRKTTISIGGAYPNRKPPIANPKSQTQAEPALKRNQHANGPPAAAVPSAVLPREMNYLVNPRHPEASSIQVVGQEGFRLDRRLVRLREE